jgi:hypothetical protein
MLVSVFVPIHAGRRSSAYEARTDFHRGFTMRCVLGHAAWFAASVRIRCVHSDETLLWFRVKSHFRFVALETRHTGSHVVTHCGSYTPILHRVSINTIIDIAEIITNHLRPLRWRNSVNNILDIHCDMLKYISEILKSYFAPEQVRTVSVLVTATLCHHHHLWDFKFSRRRVWCSELSCGMYCRVKWLLTDVSEVPGLLHNRDPFSLGSLIPDDGGITHLWPLIVRKICCDPTWAALDGLATHNIPLLTPYRYFRCYYSTGSKFSKCVSNFPKFNLLSWCSIIYACHSSCRDV